MCIASVIPLVPDGADGLCHKLTKACVKPLPVMWDMSHDTKGNWEIKRNSLKFDKKLGQGQFGEVWQGGYSALPFLGDDRVSDALIYTRCQLTLINTDIEYKLQH